MKNIKGNIIRQIVVNSLIIVLMLVIFKNVSYSVDENPTIDNKDLLVKTGNMQVVLNVPKERYEFLNSLKMGVSDNIGQRQDGYNFTITNTGNIPIEYYEIKLVDEENKISTLPHHFLRFTIKKDDEEYSDVKSLSDTNNILYEGRNLKVGEVSSFNYKMWITDQVGDISDKTLYAALEVTLYQKDEINEKYVFYKNDEGENVPFRTSIYEPISSTIPKKEGYIFLGWSTSFNGEVKYISGDTYKEEKGGTLYAIWEKMTND